MKTARSAFFILLMAGCLLAQAPPSYKPLVQGRWGVVVAGHPLSAEAGYRMLVMGGNAVDAGVAAVLAASVVELQSFGFGGETPILIRTSQGEVVAINGAGFAPASATLEFYRQHGERVGDEVVVPWFGPLAAPVPATLDALITALDRYGSLSFREVAQPAIELADGFPMYARLAAALRYNREHYAKWVSSRAFYEPNGQVPEVGEIFCQPDLARMLRELVAAEQKHQREGRQAALLAVRDYFYRGPIAQRIADFLRENGGLLTADDFAAYQATVESPLHTNYRGYEVYKAGFWTQGPVLLEMLNLLEGFDLRALGHNSPDYVHTVVEAMKLAFADRDCYYGDPSFVSVPTELLSKEYATVRQRLIDPAKASLEPRPGELGKTAGLGSASPRTTTRPMSREAHDTTSVDVIDASGLMFSATPSGAWIPAVIAGDTGIPLSQRLQSFTLEPGHPNVLAPRKRPRITLTPMLVLREGKPFLALSTVGGDTQAQALLQVFLNMVEFGMNPQEAVEAPRFTTHHLVSSFRHHEFLPGVLALEGRFSEALRQELAKRGHKIRVQDDWGARNAPTVVYFDAASGIISAGADVRGDRYAIGR